MGGLEFPYSIFGNKSLTIMPHYLYMIIIIDQ
jgi:hypothetical protein